MLGEAWSKSAKVSGQREGPQRQLMMGQRHGVPGNGGKLRSRGGWWARSYRGVSAEGDVSGAGGYVELRRVSRVISLGAKTRNGGPQNPAPRVVYSWVGPWRVSPWTVGWSTRTR